MFTGIVEEMGAIRSITNQGEGRRLTVEARTVMGDIELGASIAVNGCCLTVVDFGDDWWATDAVPETLARTTIGSLEAGHRVNLERPLAAKGRFGGHIVQGHVDGLASVEAITTQDDGSYRVRFRMAPELNRYVVEKGSICVDGVSLTIAGLFADGFEIAIIPHTWEVTRFGSYQIGDQVNIEVDILAKYVERLTLTNVNNDPKGGETNE